MIVKKIQPLLLSALILTILILASCNQDLPCLENNRAYVIAGLYFYDTKDNNAIKDTAISKLYIGNFKDYSSFAAADSFVDAYWYDSASTTKGNGIRFYLDPLEDSTYYLIQLDTIYRVDTTYLPIYGKDSLGVTDSSVVVGQKPKYTFYKRFCTDKLIFVSIREPYLISSDCGFGYRHDSLDVISDYVFIKDIITKNRLVDPSDENYTHIQIIF